MHLTWLDSNSWLFEIADQRILLDPWLVGDLVFGKQDWLFKGMRRQPRPIPENIDLILLSQGLEDHAHPETLKHLDRSIPVAASPNATKVVKEMGYENITEMPHGHIYHLDNRVTVKAFPGSPIGPFLVENAYLIKQLDGGQTLYYEPHGHHSEQIKAAAPVDIVVTPIVDLRVPLLGPVIQGWETASQVVQWLQPQYMIPTAAGGDIEFTGVLNSLLQAKGSAAELRDRFVQSDLPTQLVEPTPGERFELQVQPRTSVTA